MKKLLPAILPLERFRSLCCLLALSVAPLHGAGVNLLTNGGFETGDFTGWTATGLGIGISSTSCSPGFPLCTTPFPAHSGRFAAVLGGAVTLSQTVPTISGHTYSFSVYYDSSLPATGDQLTPIFFDPSNTQNASPAAPIHGGGSLTDSGYSLLSVTFEWTASSLAVQFVDSPCCQGTNIQSGSPLFPFALDDVTLTDLGNLNSGAPEPSTVVLLLSGLMGIGSTARRQRGTARRR
ncbi:MAG: PEP-CTERM sorting domain-containing protein [Acidobacteria bacterium]|nr:PEP-CTERM sorting domain-containing protein [Acidobacteriota bacterium]